MVPVVDLIADWARKFFVGTATQVQYLLERHIFGIILIAMNSGRG